MLGAMIGDIIGSVYEWHNVKSEDFSLFSDQSRFTDDTVLTAATASAILHMQMGRTGLFSKRYYAEQYACQYKLYGKRYPDCGFGEMFQSWCKASAMPKQHSYGNGAVMRVSPVGWAFNSLDEVIRQAKYTTVYTHSHPDSVKGACAIATAVFLARKTKDKNDIKSQLQKRFHYDLSVPLSKIRPEYQFDSSCRGSDPQAISAFLEGYDYIDTIRKAISLGGDSDTIAAMAGGIAEAFYQEIPAQIKGRAMLLLNASFGELIREFYSRFL